VDVLTTEGKILRVGTVAGGVVECVDITDAEKAFEAQKA
jgi:hypothetical protein